MSRTTKSPQQRAQEALDVAERLVTRLTEKAREHRQALKDAEYQLERASARRDYLAKHPDLAKPVDEVELAVTKVRTDLGPTGT